MRAKSDEGKLLAWVLCVLYTLCIVVARPTQAQNPAESPATQAVARFVTVDLYLDSGDHPLAAWQVELKATRGDVKIVGVEGGEHRDVYHDPPYYDPAALSGGRIILASYTMAKESPKGRIQVARVHLWVSGEYGLSAKVIASADPEAHPIDATAEVAAMPTTNPSQGKGAKQ